MATSHQSVLTPEQIQFFSDNGYLHIKGVIDSWELEHLDGATLKLIDYCKQVVPGSHLWQGFDLQEMVDEHGFNLPGAIPVITEPSDIVLHSTNILHGSRVTRGKTMRRIIYFAFFTIEELLARGGKADADYVRSWLRIMLDAVQHRARLPETADETPFAYNPTKAQFSLNRRELGFVDKQVRTLRDAFDPAYRYSPLAVVEAKTR